MFDPVPLQTGTRLARGSVLVLLLVLLLVAVSSLATASGVNAGTPDRDEQRRFMWAMAGQESGWNYYSRNPSSGAYGKYQIMPFNWPAWAKQYLGDAQADQTPYNQERMAYAKIKNLYRWLGSWKRVAYWWLTGSSERDKTKWSAYAMGYVNNIMNLRRRAPENSIAMPSRTRMYAGKGDWRLSGAKQRLLVKAAGRKWPKRGRVKDGQVVKVRRAVVTSKGARWLQVQTADGRLGWLKQHATVPARRPRNAAQFGKVAERGKTTSRTDRTHVRPRPR